MNYSIAEWQAFAAGASLVGLAWVWVTLERGRDRDRAERRVNEPPARNPGAHDLPPCCEAPDRVPGYPGAPHCRNCGTSSLLTKDQIRDRFERRRRDRHPKTATGVIVPRTGAGEQVAAHMERRREAVSQKLTVDLDVLGEPPEWYNYVVAARDELVREEMRDAALPMVKFDDVIARAKAMAEAARINMRD